MKITKKQLIKMIQEELSETLQEEADGTGDPIHKAVAALHRAREIAGQIAGGRGRNIGLLLNRALKELETLSEGKGPLLPLLPVNEESRHADRDCIRDLMKVEGYSWKEAEYICRYGGSNSRLGEEAKPQEQSPVDAVQAALDALNSDKLEDAAEQLQIAYAALNALINSEELNEAPKGGENTVPIEEAEKGKCPESGCIKKSGDKWRIISNKTGKLWPQHYDTKGDAEDALQAYHVHN